MPSHELDLTALLTPLSCERFFAECWERQPLHLPRRDEHFYDRLLTTEDVDGLIARSDARYPAVRLSKGGAFYPPEAYTRDVKNGDDAFTGVVDPEKVFTEYLSGATVSLPALQWSWAPLAALCVRLEAQLDHVVHANAYVTAARTAGFTPHYDTHEVLILQIAGAKHWRIDAPPIHLPHRSQPFSPEGYTQPAAALLEVELTAGDLLYLPRGYVHSTTTSECFSIHVTLGINVYTWSDLLAELLLDVRADPRLRAALPPGFARHSVLQHELKREWREFAAGFVKGADYDRLWQGFQQRVALARSRVPGGFRSNVSTLGPDTALRVVAGRQYRLGPHADSALLELDGRRVRLPLPVRSALESICANPSFQTRTLPGNLSLDAKLALVRYLYGLGFIERVP